MTVFFDSLSYELPLESSSKLLWTPRGENDVRYGGNASPIWSGRARRVASLGPDYEVYLQATTEPGTTPWETENTQLLAYWHNRPRESGDPSNLEFAGVMEMCPLPYDEPSLAFFQDFPDGDTTCEAGWLYYRSRCPIRHRLAAEGRSPELEW